MDVAKARKALVSGVFLAGAIALLILNKYDPTFPQAVAALAGAVAAVVAVFGAKNVTADDWSKAVAQLQAAALWVAGFFTEIPTSTVERITVIVGALLSVGAVHQVANGEEQLDPADDLPIEPEDEEEILGLPPDTTPPRPNPPTGGGD